MSDNARTEAESPPASDVSSAIPTDGGEFVDSVELTDDELAEALEPEGAPLPLTYSGQDFDVAGLVRRLQAEDIMIPRFGHNDDRIASAGFQRSFVWTRPQMDRFVESLLLGFPIPGVFLVRQPDRRYLVLDGQQRLRTLEHFYAGVHDGKEFALANVATDYKGLTYKKLGPEQRRLLDDAFIQATIVTTDGSSASLESIYQLFERLNSGGTQLTPHEIRVALFAGPFIEFLEELNNNPAWRKIYGKHSPRLRDQELVLRVLALYLNAGAYKRPLKTFLNDFIADHRGMSKLNADEVRARFTEASDVLAEVGPAAIRTKGNQINAALTEALYVGLMRRLDHGTPLDSAGAAQAVERVKEDPKLLAAISRATADEEQLRVRLEVATARFAKV